MTQQLALCELGNRNNLMIEIMLCNNFSIGIFPMPQPTRLGSQLLIAASNTGDGVYYMQHPKIVGLHDGGFIAVWQQYHETTSVFDATSIQGQFYNADGTKRGAQFQIDAPLYEYGDLNVSNPSVIVKKDGKVVVAWKQELHAAFEWSDRSEIRIREIDSTVPDLSGMLGLVTRASVSHDSDGRSEFNPNLSATQDGGYTLEFSSFTNSDSEYYNEYLSELYSDHYVLTPGNQVPIEVGSRGDVAGLAGGGMVQVHFVKRDHGPFLSTQEIEAHVFCRSKSGDLVDRVVSFSPKFLDSMENLSVVGLTNGDFAVVWQDKNGDGSGTCIKARIFKVDKSKIDDAAALHKIDIVPATGEIVVNTKTAGAQIMPVVEALPGGGFVVAFQDWASSTNPYAMDIRVAAFNAAGGRVGDDMLVAAEMDGRQTNPSIAVLRDGRFVVSWQDGGGGRIKAQIFGEGSNPNPNPNPEPVPTSTMGTMGDDTLDGTQITGLIDGGGGFDTVSYASSGDLVVVFIDPSTAQFNQRAAAGDRYTNVEAFIGTNFDDEFFGHTGHERIDGGRGNDRLEGGEGNDHLIGGEGNDTLNGGSGADTLVGDAGDNTYVTDSTDTVIRTEGSGKQTVQANVSYALSKSVKIDVLKAGSSVGAIDLTGNGFSEEIIGNAGRNTLKGRGGNDKLFGGKGEDILVGGKGKDVFVFDTKLGTGNVDTISDFDVKDDSIWLDNAVFAKLGKKGSATKPAQLKKQFFVVGDKAEDANDYIIYDKTSGTLSYDVDGSGSRAAVTIATLKPDLALSHKDFFVI